MIITRHDMDIVVKDKGYGEKEHDTNIRRCGMAVLNRRRGGAAMLLYPLMR